MLIMACCGGGKKAINKTSQPATMKNLAKPQKQATYSKITLADGKQYRVAGRKQNHIKHAAN